MIKFGLDLDDIISHVPKKKKVSRVNASYGGSLFASLWTFCKVYFFQMSQKHCKIINLTKLFNDYDC
jgi:hypothetical protein